MFIAKHDLARLLSSVTKAVEKSTMPILATVRLVADGTALNATATNLDIEITGSIPADGTLSCCVDAKLLAGIVAKAGSDVTLEHEGTTLTVKSGRSRFKLQTLPVEDFPDLTAGEFTTTFEAGLSSVFGAVQFAISTELTRYYLNGVYLEPTAATATDGHRLAHVTTDLPAFEPIIVPSKTVALWPKGSARVSLSGTKIRVQTAATDGTSVTMTSKLIDGTYPDYRRVIPTQNDKHVLADKAALQAAVARVSTVATERGRAVKLEIAPGQVGLSVRGDAEATDSVEVDYSGEPLEIGFNSAYLAEILANVPGDTVRIALADNGSPTLFTAPDKDGQVFVCMPMRTT